MFSIVQVDPVAVAVQSCLDGNASWGEITVQLPMGPLGTVHSAVQSVHLCIYALCTMQMGYVHILSSVQW